GVRGLGGGLANLSPLSPCKKLATSGKDKGNGRVTKNQIQIAPCFYRLLKEATLCLAVLAKHQLL
ncbi:hypothetical protein, partial [Helicobacter sp. CLO-3]|uniref:hypothetical protein n=1 Tax=Helicobacter sp. CLO-3 TaxID=211 RepID=UPI001C12B4DF